MSPQPPNPTTDLTTDHITDQTPISPLPLATIDRDWAPFDGNDIFSLAPTKPAKASNNVLVKEEPTTEIRPTFILASEAYPSKRILLDVVTDNNLQAFHDQNGLEPNDVDF